ncbi:MAG: ABC transporter ATP-binding protein [bacterium]
MELSIETVSNEMGEFFISLTLVFTFWIGSQLVIKETLTLGGLLAFTLLFERLVQPWEEFLSLNDDLQMAIAATERFYEIFDVAPDIKDEVIELPEIKGNIEFRNVSFSYDGKQEALSEINLSIKEGSTLALVGRSGAGKSTLTYLILRFYNPSSGSVLIDRYNLADVKTSSLRKQIALVSQEPFLFSGTIRENLGFRLKINEDEWLKKFFSNQKTQRVRSPMPRDILQMPRRHYQNLLLNMTAIRMKSM